MAWEGVSGAQWEEHFWPLVGLQMRQEVPWVSVKPAAQCVEKESADAQRFAFVFHLKPISEQKCGKLLASTPPLILGEGKRLCTEAPITTNGK